jgi:diguanylate cyclase (GGDEF)-like protein
MSEATGAEGLFQLVNPLDRIIRRSANAATERRSPVERAPAADPERERLRFAALCELSAVLATGRADFEEALARILDLFVRFARAERGLLLLLGPGGAIELEVARNDREEPLERPGAEVPRAIVERALSERRPIYVADVPAAGEAAASAAALGLRSVLCVPLQVVAPPANGRAPGPERRRLAPIAEPDLLGAIYADSALAACAVDSSDLDFFGALANQATATLLNARIYQQATTDPLSQLYTRRHFQQLLAEAVRRAEQRRTPTSLLLLDVDDFKRVNDGHGHLAGDEVIRDVGAALRGSTRAIDACFRYGGDEFAVLLADTDREGARITADKLRQAIGERRFGERGFGVAVSIGFATAPVDAQDPQELVKRADQALYHAKMHGKDRVAGWTPALGAAAKRGDRLAGIVTGDFAADYNNVQLLIDTIAAINGTSDIGELLTLAVDKVIEATGADRGALMLADGAPPRLSTVVARDRKKQDLKLVEKFSRTIPERVLASGESVCVVDTADEGEGRGPFSHSIAELALRTIMCVPLATKDRTIGVIYVDSRTRSGNLRESNLPFFEGLARQVAFAIENARLKAKLALGGVAE